MGRHKPVRRATQHTRLVIGSGGARPEHRSGNIAMSRTRWQRSWQPVARTVEFVRPAASVETITEVDLDIGGNIVQLFALSPIPIGALSDPLTAVWGLPQNGQGYFDSAGAAAGENASIVQDGLGGLVIRT